MVTDFSRLSEVVYKPGRPIMGEEIQDIILQIQTICTMSTYISHPFKHIKQHLTMCDTSIFSNTATRIVSLLR